MMKFWQVTLVGWAREMCNFQPLGNNRRHSCYRQHRWSHKWWSVDQCFTVLQSAPAHTTLNYQNVVLYRTNAIYRHLLNTPSFINLTNLYAILLFLILPLVFTLMLRSCSLVNLLIKRICMYVEISKKTSAALGTIS